MPISREELEEMRKSGAEIEIEPQRLVVEGLIEQLKALVPDNSAVLSEIKKLTEAISKLAAHSTVVECTPTIDCTPRVESVNNVTVDTTPLIQAIDRMMHRPDYRFTITRNNRGFIESMNAEVVERNDHNHSTGHYRSSSDCMVR